jgi:hypothetical protein
MAAGEVRLYPAVDVLQSFREHASFTPCPLVDGQHVIIGEVLDDHEWHPYFVSGCVPCEQVTRSIVPADLVLINASVLTMDEAWVSDDTVVRDLGG